MNLTPYFALLNALYLAWMAGLALTTAGAADILRWWEGSWLWSSVGGAVPHALVTGTAALTGMMAAAFLLCYRVPRLLMAGAALATLSHGFNALYFFTNPVWLASMGGFPFLGSGQGIIKYLPMLATSVYLLGQRRLAFHLAWSGILLVMGGIGAMKFFLFEAEGIEPLLRGHLLFDWMYRVWDLQGVSNVIGIVELAVAALVLASLRWKALAPLALAGIAATVASTLSFMFTLPGWDAGASFPLLNRSGVFLLKDQFLLAAAFLLLRR
jgi:uncharacterized membrane protein YkgB